MPKASHIIALFFALSLVMQPAFPFIEYALFKDYIVQNLCVEREIEDSCCQGKCHLAERLESTNEPVSEDNKPVPIRTSIKVMEYDFVYMNYSVNCNCIQPKNKISKRNFYTYTFLTDCFHPPKTV